jgi:hypothetical protein
MDGFTNESTTSDEATRYLILKPFQNGESAAPQGTVATIQPTFVADKVVKYTSEWRQIVITGEMMQPFVKVDCEPLYARRNGIHGDSSIRFGSPPSMDQRVPLLTEGEAFASAQLIDGPHII